MKELLERIECIEARLDELETDTLADAQKWRRHKAKMDAAWQETKAKLANDYINGPWMSEEEADNRLFQNQQTEAPKLNNVQVYKIAKADGAREALKECADRLLQLERALEHSNDQPELLAGVKFSSGFIAGYIQGAVDRAGGSKDDE